MAMSDADRKEKVRVYNAKYRAANLDSVKAGQKLWRDANPEMVRSGRSKWCAEHKNHVKDYGLEYHSKPENIRRRRAYAIEYKKRPVVKKKNQARGYLKYAISTGKLARLPCEVCGHEPAEGHHDDYSKPLDVRWLCKKHHTQHHKDERKKNVTGK